MMKMNINGILMLIGMVLMMMMTMGEAAELDAGCAEKLNPCLQFVYSKNPPQSCCTPIQDIVVNDLSCLCFLYTNADVLQTYGLNRTLAVGVVRRCGLTVSFASCHDSADPPSAQATLPKATPGADVGSAGRVSSIHGISLFLIFICSALLFH